MKLKCERNYPISVEYLHVMQRKVRKIGSKMTDRQMDGQTSKQWSSHQPNWYRINKL
jgi:hypothetical protein